MGEYTMHLAVVEVQDEHADVTLEGDLHDIADLCEAADIKTMLQRELKEWNEKQDNSEVEITPRKGFSAIADKEEE